MTNPDYNQQALDTRQIRVQACEGYNGTADELTSAARTASTRGNATC